MITHQEHRSTTLLEPCYSVKTTTPDSARSRQRVQYLVVRLAAIGISQRRSEDIGDQLVALQRLRLARDVFAYFVLLRAADPHTRRLAETRPWLIGGLQSIATLLEDLAADTSEEGAA